MAIDRQIERLNLIHNWRSYQIVWQHQNIMKKIICIIVLSIPLLIKAQSSQIDVVHLNNGSILKGTVTEMMINESLTIKMDNGSIIKVKFAEVKKVVKETTEETGTIEVVLEDEIEEEGKPKKKKGKFWKALGNIAVATLNRTAENVKNGRSDENTYDESSDIEEDETENEINENIGSMCFINPNFYSRKVVLTNRITGKQETILVGKASYGKTVNSCAYDITAGIYDCKVYTTFSRKMIEQYNIRINPNDETSKMLTKNHYN